MQDGLIAPLSEADEAEVLPEKEVILFSLAAILVIVALASNLFAFLVFYMICDY